MGKSPIRTGPLACEVHKTYPSRIPWEEMIVIPSPTSATTAFTRTTRHLGYAGGYL